MLRDGSASPSGAHGVSCGRALRVAPWAASELDIRREVADLHDEPEVLAALACWDGERFTVTSDALEVHAGLTALANGCDDLAEHDTHPETRAHNRWARDGLTALASRVLRGAP